MFYNNTEIEAQPILEKLPKEDTWSDVFKASIKNVTSVGLSISAASNYKEALKPSVDEWIAKDPDSASVYTKLNEIDKKTLDLFDSLYQDGKQDMIRNWDIGSARGGHSLGKGAAYLTYKDKQVQFGFKDLSDIWSDGEEKAKSDFLSTTETMQNSDKTSAKLLGQAVGYLNEPMTIATLPIGSWKTGGSIALNAIRAFGEEAALETAVQAVVAPNVYSYKKTLGIQTSVQQEAINALGAITSAGVFRGTGSALFDLTAKGIKVLKLKDKDLGEAYETLIKGQVTDNLNEHADNLYKAEFSPEGVDKIVNPNEEGKILNNSEPLKEFNDELLVTKDSPINKTEPELEIVIGYDEKGMPEVKSYGKIQEEFDAQDTMLDELINCLKGAK